MRRIRNPVYRFFGTVGSNPTLSANRIPSCTRRSLQGNLLSMRAVQTAQYGDRSDGGGLLLRVRDDSTNWVLQYTEPNGCVGSWNSVKPRLAA